MRRWLLIRSPGGRITDIGRAQMTVVESGDALMDGDLENGLLELALDAGNPLPLGAAIEVFVIPLDDAVLVDVVIEQHATVRSRGSA